MKNREVSNYLDEYKGYKVGSVITITSKPNSWSSTLNSNYYKDSNIKFPYTFKIKEIAVSINDHISMTCGKFGWAFDDLIRDNKVKWSQQEERKFKLNKIKRL